MSYYIRHEGQKRGPFSDAQMITLLLRGTISENTEATLDENEWRHLGDLHDFKRLQSLIAVQHPKPPAGFQASESGISGAIPPPPPTKSDAGTVKKPNDLKTLLVIGGVVFVLGLSIIVFAGVSRSRREAAEALAAAQAEQERQATEAKDAAEKAEWERRVAEAKAAAKEVQEHRDAEARVAASAERERKEAEAKAAAVKAEQERRENEDRAAAEKAAKKTNNSQLDALPDLWSDIALPSSSVGKQILLPGSEFLGTIKDDVTISIVPFVNLNANAILQASQPHSVGFSLKSADEAERILDVSLGEGGISYEWNAAALGKYRDTDFHRTLNRILLSKLLIEIRDYEPKEIALWGPVTYTASEFAATFKTVGGRVRFTMRPNENGNEFAEDPKNELLLLDFDKLTRSNTVHTLKSKVFEPRSLAYIPIIPSDIGSGLTCEIRATQGKESRMYIDFDSDAAREWEEKKRNKEEEIKPVQKNIDAGRQLLSQTKSRINGVEKANKMKKQNIFELHKRLSHPKANTSVINAQITQLENEIAWNNSPLNPDGLPQEYQREKGLFAKLDELDAQKAGLQSQLRAIQETLTAERKKLEQIQVDHFSIDQIKTGTPASNVHEPENRLTLFRVVP